MSDKGKFIEIIKENEGILFKISFVYTDGKEGQKDLYQEIVYQLWKSFDSFRGESKASTWIYRIALNTSIAYLIKQKKSVPLVPLEFALLSSNQEDDSLIEIRMGQVHQQISKLNIIEKGLILLYLEGKSYNEIASITGFSTTNVGTKLARINDKLKSQITKY